MTPTARSALREPAAERRRFGYRRLHRPAAARGPAVNQKQPAALPRGAADGTPARRPQAGVGTGRRRSGRGQADSLVHRLRPDQLTDGRRFRILASSTTSPGMPGAVADTSISGRRVARELDALVLGGASRRSSSATTAPSSLQRHADLGRGGEGRLAFHRARQADAERHLRGLQRPLRDEL